MSEKVLSAGDEIDSYCTTCKIVLAHQIVALVEDKVDKVICKTCGKKHKYRPNPPKSRQRKTKQSKTSKTGTTAKKTTRTRRTKDPAIKWEEALAEKANSPVKEYAMHGIFEQDDIIEHEKFGRGLVTEVYAEKKMEVIFKDGTKVMVFDRDIG